MYTFRHQRIPLELVSRILDETAGQSVSSRKSLKNCSLVCRSWVYYSSAHLLHAIDICAPQLEQYLGFAKTSPRLQAHVRELIIDGNIDVTLYLDDITATTPRLTTLELWSNTTQRFARPPDLALCDPEDRKVLYYYIKAPVGTCPARGGSIDINYLKLSSLLMLSVALTVRPFNRIGILELRAVRQEVRIDSRTVVQRYGRLLPLYPHPTVEHLIVDGCWDSNITFMLARIPLRPTSLAILKITYEDMSSFLGFLQDAGREIEHISLSPTGGFLLPAYDGNGLFTSSVAYE